MAHFISTFPDVPSYSSKFAQEEMTYKATVRVPHDQQPSEVQVQAWTCQCDETNAQGDWHFVDLNLCESNGDMHTYERNMMITNQKDFSFTFRLRMPYDHDWRWTRGFKQDGMVNVHPARAPAE